MMTTQTRKPGYWTDEEDGAEPMTRQQQRPPLAFCASCNARERAIVAGRCIVCGSPPKVTDRLDRLTAALLCPRCKREVHPWPLKRGAKCSPKGWAHCIRNDDPAGWAR